MTTLDLVYAASDEFAYRLPTLSILAERARIADEIGEDARGIGFAVDFAGPLSAMLGRDPVALGDGVLVDCPTVGGAELAALARLDLQAARNGTAIIVATTIAALDDVFACLELSSPQILVEASRAERLVALGRWLVSSAGSVVREIPDDDRLTLLRLTEQVGQIARQLERLSELPESASAAGESAFRFESPRPAFAAQSDDGSERLVRATRPALPDPRLVRRIIRQRQLRARFFEGDLFADPAWDMLLDLAAARAEHTRVSVTSLCIASGVPPTTALRWIGQMTDAGLLCRVEDETDRRRAFITLTDKAADAMARYFAELGRAGAALV